MDVPLYGRKDISPPEGTLVDKLCLSIELKTKSVSTDTTCLATVSSHLGMHGFVHHEVLKLPLNKHTEI